MNISTPQEVAADIAKELKEHPERWTCGCYARDSQGVSAPVAGASAVQWCLLGHVVKRTVLNTALADLVIDKLHGRIVQRGFVSTALWNDARGRTVPEVIKLCEEVAQS